MNFIYVIHLLYWNHLTDLITQQQEQQRPLKQQRGARAKRAPPLLFPFPLFMLLLLLLLCMIRSVSWFQYNKWMT